MTAPTTAADISAPASPRATIRGHHPAPSTRWSALIRNRAAAASISGAAATPTSSTCRSANPRRCSTNSGPMPRATRTPGTTPGASATSCCGTIAAPCTGAIPSIPPRVASCTAPRSRPRRARRSDSNEHRAEASHGGSGHERLAAAVPAHRLEPGAVAALPHVPAALCRPREHLDCGTADQEGARLRQRHARPRLRRLRLSLRRAAAHRRLARRRARRAPHARHLRLHRLRRDGAHRRGQQLPLALSRALRARRRRGRRLSDGDARHGALAAPLIALLIGYLSWRGSFVVLGLVSLVWVAVWVWFFRDEPRQHPLIGADELATLPAARRAEAPRSWRQRLREWPPLARRILPVTAVDFCYGWTLWLFLSWIPSFFYESFHLPLKDSALFSSGVFLAGVIGDTLGGIISDRLLQRSGDVRRARCSVIAAGLFGAFLFLIPVVFVHDLALTALCLSLAFFSAELVVAPIWSVPMDIAPDYAGTASGMMNFGFGLAGMISPWFFGKMIDVTGSWTYPFLGSIALLLFGALMALRLRPDLRFEARAPVTAAA